MRRSVGVIDSCLTRILLVTLVLANFGLAHARASNCPDTAQLLDAVILGSRHKSLKPEAQEFRNEVWPALTAEVPSLRKFLDANPFHPTNPTQDQTWIQYKDELFRLENYDEQTGIVRMSRNDLEYLPFRPGTATGDLVTNHQKQYEVIALDTFHLKEQDQVMLAARKLTVEVNFENLKPALASPIRFETISGQPRINFANQNVFLPGPVRKAPIIYPMGAEIIDSPFNKMREVLKLEPDRKINVKWLPRSNRNNGLMRVKDFTKMMESELDIIRIYSEKNQKKLSHYIESSVTGSAHPQFLYAEPRLSHVYNFKFRGDLKGGGITVYAPTARSAAQDAKDRKMIVRFMKSIPKSLRYSVDVIYLDRGGVAGNGFAGANAPSRVGARKISLYYKTGFDFSSDSIVASILSRPGVDETLWHELTHHLEYQAPERIQGFNMKIWEDAIVRDRAWPTSYSKIRSREDFPETNMVYVSSDAGNKLKNGKNLRELYPERFAILDRLMK